MGTGRLYYALDRFSARGFVGFSGGELGVSEG